MKGTTSLPERVKAVLTIDPEISFNFQVCSNIIIISSQINPHWYKNPLHSLLQATTKWFWTSLYEDSFKGLRGNILNSMEILWSLYFYEKILPVSIWQEFHFIHNPRTPYLSARWYKRDPQHSLCSPTEMGTNTKCLPVHSILTLNRNAHALSQLTRKTNWKNKFTILIMDF